MQLSVAPTFHRYMLDLERENRVLWRANSATRTRRLGVADSAAAARSKRIDELDQPPPSPVAPSSSDQPTAGRRVAKFVFNLLPHAIVTTVMRYRERARSGRGAQVAVSALRPSG